MKTYCIVLASGTGSRFGGDRPKQFVPVCGHMVLEYTLDACLRTEAVDEVVLVVSDLWIIEMESLVVRMSRVKPIRVVAGGRTRLESCEKGLTAIEESEAKVLIHNGVQPFVTPKTLTDCTDALDRYDAVSVGSPCVYTVLEVDENRELKRIVRRDRSVNDLGPECFKLSFLRRVLDMAHGDSIATNLTGLVVKHGLGPVYVVDGDPSNTKITYADDVLFAEKKFADYKFLEIPDNDSSVD